MEAPVSKAIGRVKFGWRLETESEVVVAVGAEATTVEAEATTVVATEVDGVIVVASPITRCVYR